MSPTPRRQPMITCTDCGRANDPGRGSTRCWYCGAQLPSSELQVFDVAGSGIRFGVTEHGRPYVVAEDFTPSLGYSRARDALRMVDADEKGAQSVRTPGGPQQMAVLYEDGIWELIFLSRRPEAKAIKKRVKAILREIRETGSYSARRELTRLELIDLARDAELGRLREMERAEQAEHRAELAEGTVREIEGANGLTLRMFHKKYFSEVREREFFEHLYAKGYLIDQRGKGKVRADGSARDGAEHRHPSFKGKPYLYLHFNGVHGDRRRETTRVRPGQPELDFKAALVRDGLKANGNDDGFLFGIEGGA